MLDFHSRDWSGHLHNLVRCVDTSLFIASPYITRRPLEQVAEILQARSRLLQTHILTNLFNGSESAGSLDVDALTEFANDVEGTTVSHLPSLHAKVFIADSRVAIITSANLTNGGLKENVEYGVLLREERFVKRVRKDFEGFSRLGCSVPLEILSDYANDVRQIRRDYLRLEDSTTEQSKAKLTESLAQSQVTLMKARARGETTNGILARTIVFLLEKHGPLATVELHPHIQGLHPDICDDNVDRVIGDVHFGKRWKHYVRNAQQGLKRQERIDLRSDGRWHLLR